MTKNSQKYKIIRKHSQLDKEILKNLTANIAINVKG